MNSAEAGVILAQLKDHGRVRRWFGLGARAEELFDTFGKIHELGDWCKEFGKLAQRFEKGADAIDDGTIKVANYLSAASYFHIGLLGTFADDEERKQAYRSVVRLRQSAKIFPYTCRAGGVCLRRSYVFRLFSSGARSHPVSLRYPAERARRCQGSRAAYDFKLPFGKRPLHTGDRYRRPRGSPLSRLETASRRDRVYWRKLVDFCSPRQEKIGQITEVNSCGRPY